MHRGQVEDGEGGGGGVREKAEVESTDAGMRESNVTIGVSTDN